jgi:protein-disulfide isomerase
MSKKNRERRQGAGESAPVSGSEGPSGGIAWLPTVLAVAALGLSFYLWSDANSTKKENSSKFAEVEGRVAQLAQAVTAAQRPPQPQGPDPNKVYPVNLDGAPARGNAGAPIVIAEFSDYQ